jgi:hypothetical protein
MAATKAVSQVQARGWRASTPQDWYLTPVQVHSRRDGRVRLLLGGTGLGGDQLVIEFVLNDAIVLSGALAAHVGEF